MSRSEQLERLLQATQEMRQLQREYFATRSKTVLESSKAQERAVDKLIAEINSNTSQGVLNFE